MKGSLARGRVSIQKPPWFLAALVLVVGVGVTWAALVRWRPPIEQTRARLYADAAAGRFDDCEAALAWLARHDSLRPLDLMARAQLAQARGRPDEALRDLQAIPDRDPVAVPARLQAARIHAIRHRARDAEAALKAALALDPRLTPARLELIRLYARQQRHGELDEQFEALAEQNSLTFTYLSFWGMTRSLPWEPRSDLEELRRSVEADPDDRASRLALAEGLRRLARGPEAEAVLARLPADDLDARSLRAALAMDRADLDETMLEGPETHAGLARLRGQLALTRDQPATAIAHFRAALGREPGNRQNLFSLGMALKLVGQDAEAGRCLEAARRFEVLAGLAARTIEPKAASDADLHRRLGAACEGVGRLAEARAWYRLAVGLDPLDLEAQRGLFRLGPGPVATRSGEPLHVATPLRSPADALAP